MSAERRQTPSERSHELLRMALERPAPVSGNPSFQVNQEKAVGGATVWTWQVHVPVCEEYPTAEEAFQASIEYANSMRILYPPPSGDVTLAQQLQDSLPKDSPRHKDGETPKPRRVK